MINYTIPNQDVYARCVNRLENLKITFPQTEEIKTEIKMIEEEILKYKVIQNCIRNN